MKTSVRFLALAAALALAAPLASASDALAIRVGRAETVSNGTIEHAVVLVESGTITIVGEDLPVERGIPVLDRPEWVAIPGLVNAYSRLGMSSTASTEDRPHETAIRELDPGHPYYDDALEAGVTTLALYPPGRGLPGQALVVRTAGKTAEQMLLEERAYLKVVFESNSRSKKLIRDGFEKVDDYIEKEKKAREKYDKAVEKAKKKKKSSKSKKDDDKDKKDDEETDSKDDEKADEGPGPYVPPEVDPKVQVFMDLRSGDRSALVSMRKAADYLHWIDAIGDEEFEWSLRIPVNRNLDFFHVAEDLGKTGCHVVMEPQLSNHPSTMRVRNMPLELSEAGCKVVFIPEGDTPTSFEDWREAVAEIVAWGFDREAALRAMTLEPAKLLGVDDRVGSIEAGKHANMVFLSGDPFEVGTRVEAVMLEGELVFEEEVQ